MKTSSSMLYIDAFAGISGDMFLGALSDLLPSPELFETLPARLGFQHASLAIRAINRRGIAARQVDIQAPHEHHHRHLKDIQAMLEKSDLPVAVVQKALKSFLLLAEAEAKVHGTTPDKIHFHEVGAVDSILDITGTHLGIHELGIESVVCSPLPLSRGSIQIAHGTFPSPAPATVELLKGVPTCSIDAPFETVTPTGACLAATLSDRYENWPSMIIERCGWGTGTREGGALPNVLRLVMGTSTQGFRRDQVWVLECEVDDMQPELLEPLWKAAFEKGALDLYFTPVQMKKGRPGTLLTLLASDISRVACEKLLLEHTTTFGVRRSLCERAILERQMVQVETEYGIIPVKTCPGMPGKFAPEADAVKHAAHKAGAPMGVVFLAAQMAYQNGAFIR